MKSHISRRHIARPARRKTRRRLFEHLENRHLLNGTTLLVTNTADSGAGSLRQAILDANAASQLPATIDFNISTGDSGYGVDSPGVWTIAPQSALPSLTVRVTVDGTSQPGYAGTPLIELNGTQAGSLVNGLTVGSGGGGSTIEGLIVGGFGGNGIELDAGGNTLENNYIGTNAAGNVALPNGANGVEINGPNNTIGGANTNPGGTLAGAGNLISGNLGDGILITGTSATGNVVAGNFVGIDVTGTAALGNATTILYGAGIEINGASNDIVGGVTAGARNVISGNANFSHQTDAGIKLDGKDSGNTIEGNNVGTDVTGGKALSNEIGIVLDSNSTDDMIGGTASGAGNVISGNLVQVAFNGVASILAGNFIGTDPTGTFAVQAPGETAGVSINYGANLTVGGSVPAARNVISGNWSAIGTSANAVSGVIEGNYIGTDASGEHTIGGGAWGIQIVGGPGVTIGGTAPGDGNVVSGYSEANISLQGSGAVVEGNYVGTDAAGTAALGGGDDYGGILIGAYHAASGNIVGGNTPSARNVIAGSTYGVYIAGGAAGNLVQGNFIGTDASGNNALSNGDGIKLVGASGNTITGNVISGNALGYAGNTHGDGISTDATSSGNTFSGNFIGTNAAGNAALPNSGAGVVVAGPNNTIGGVNTNPGGTLAGAGNLISGNIGDGILITGTSATGNVVAGNFVGTDVTGTVALGNATTIDSGAGIEINGAANNLIGGTTAGARNVISGNANTAHQTDSGIRLDGNNSDNTIEGNYIGTDSTGEAAIQNYSGVSLEDGSAGNMIGGTAPGARNVISSNTVQVNFDDSAGHGNTVAGNYIGTDAGGTRSLQVFGESEGINLNWGNQETIGGSVPGARNVISGDFWGISGGGLPQFNGVIEGNYIGTDYTGEAVVGNESWGINVAGSGITIGGTSAGDRNVIAGHFAANVALSGSSGGTIVEGNYIGTDATGTVGLGYGNYGIQVTGGGNTIGGTTASARNVISGNATGIYVSGAAASGNLIEGNYIGTDPTGDNAVTNDGYGVHFVGASNNSIVGNLISGNTFGDNVSGNAGDGVLLDASSNSNLIAGNLIGTNAAGNAALPNAGAGISISGSNNTIGGLAADARNVISGNGVGVPRDGVVFNSGATGNVLEGNYIGTDITGTVSLGNSSNGVEIDGAAGNTIGGAAAGAGNLISGNVGDGVYVDAASSSNTIAGNLVGTMAAGATPIVKTLYPANNGFEVPNLAADTSVVKPANAGWTFINAGQGIASNASGGGNFDNGNSDGTKSSFGQAAYIQGENVGGSEFYQTIPGFQAGTASVTFSFESFSTAYSPIEVYLDSIFLGTYVPASNVSFNSVTTPAIAITPGSHRLLFSQVDGSLAGVYIDDVSITNTQRAVPNDQGVVIAGANNTLGGTSAAARNVISGNLQNGVQITGLAATGDAMEGNYIGVDANGAVALGNGSSGIVLDASNNVIGGTAGGSGNVISGNQNDGVVLPGAGDSANTIEGNYIGTNSAGQSPLANVNNGIEIDGPGNVIGGTTTGARNIISGNSLSGLSVVGANATGNLVEGNYIGTDVTGMVAVANGLHGVSFAAASGNTVGGSLAGAGNLISGNANDGVYIDATSSQDAIAGNLIGTNASGTGRLAVNSASGLGVPAVPQPNGLVRWWQGYGYGVTGGGNGTLVGTVGYNTGVYGDPFQVDQVLTFGALRFDGNDGNYVTMADSPSLELTQATIGAWIDMAAAPSVGLDYIVATKGVVGTAENYSLYVTNLGGGDLELAVQTNNGTVTKYVSTGAGLTTGQPFYVFATLDGTTVSFYVNGKLVSQTPQLAALTTNSGPLQIGSAAPGASNSFNGFIEYLQIYNRALSANEIAGMFANVSNLRGIEVDGPNNLIGGTTAGARNVISGNAGDGILILGSTATGNTVEGNYIGPDVTGATALGNGLLPHSSDDVPYRGNGIEIAGASENTIGGTTAGARNIISGNDGPNGDGVAVLNYRGQSASSGNTIEGNYIGTDAAGSHVMSNQSGVSLSVASANNVIGGIAPGAGNVISGNFAVQVGFDDGGGQNVVEGNYIGTDATGTFAVEAPGEAIGVSLNHGTNETVGGNVPAARNVISGSFAQITISSNNVSGVIEGNYIGTDATGEHVIADSPSRLGLLNGWGITVSNGDQSGVVIGGTSPGDGNVISGNFAWNVDLQGSGARVQGNYIGTDATGTIALGGGDEYGDVYVPGGTNNIIGGDTPGARNVIAGSTYGVNIAGGAAGNLVEGNYIGTDASGNNALANYGDAVKLASASNNTISDNLISGSAYFYNNPNAGGGNGIEMDAASHANTASGNLIGANAAGTAALPNAANGVEVAGSSNTIGGTAAGQANTIAYNGHAGVAVVGGNATSNAIEANSIFANKALGIDLGGGGTPVLNDSLGHVGPNDFQDFPIVTVAQGGSSTTVVGTFNAAAEPNATIKLDFYLNSAKDPSGYGQGQAYLGSTCVTTDSTGAASFTKTFSVPSAVGQFVSATATDSAGNTSEFSPDASVTLLTASISGPSSAAVGQSTLFNSTVNEGDANATVSYAWSVVDANNNNVTPETHSGTSLSFVPAAIGSYTITLTVSDSDGDVAVTTSTLSVTQAAPAVSITDAGGTYSGLGSAATATVAGVVAGIDTTPSSTLEGVGLTVSYYVGTDTSGTPLSSAPVGVGTYTAEAYFPGSTDYTSASASVTFTISPATLTVTADNKTRVFGAPNPTLTDTITGFVNGETSAVVTGAASLSTAATVSSNVGNYTITVGPGTLAAANYTFALVNGTLTITQDPSTTAASAVVSGLTAVLSATVTANAPGSGTPTGSVDFFDTTTGDDLGSVTLVAGSASLVTGALPVGTQSIAVAYSGDTNYQASSTSVSATPVASAYVLSPTAAGALTISGNASLTVPGPIDVDSSSSAALEANGNASATASAIDTVGGYQAGSHVTFSPAPVTGIAPFADPLASLPSPSTTGLSSYGSVSLKGTASQTITPGIYTEISVSGNASLTLNPGVYIIEGGGLTVTGGASISGTGVMFYNAGSNYPTSGGNFGGITLGGTGTLNLSASQTGPYAGVVIFQSRANTRAISLSGNATSSVNGTIYAANALLTVNGNAQLQSAAVVGTLNVAGNVALTQMASGSDGTGDVASIADTLLAGNLSVYINDPNGLFTTDELARLQTAIDGWDAILAPYSVTIAEVSDPSLANLVIDTGTTSACGTAAQGVLGCYNGAANEITLLQGWNWYAGADATLIGADQYDFQTTVTHELGHALGLGGSTDANSPMNEWLAAGMTHRIMTAADLNVPEAPTGADPLTAAGYERFDDADSHAADANSTVPSLNAPLGAAAEHAPGSAECNLFFHLIADGGDNAEMKPVSGLLAAGMPSSTGVSAMIAAPSKDCVRTRPNGLTTEIGAWQDPFDAVLRGDTEALVPQHLALGRDSLGDATFAKRQTDETVAFASVTEAEIDAFFASVDEANAEEIDGPTCVQPMAENDGTVLLACGVSFAVGAAWKRHDDASYNNRRAWTLRKKHSAGDR